MSLKQLQQMQPTSANPWLALLPEGVEPDIDYWDAYLHAWAADRGMQGPAAAGFANVVITEESEPNDDQGSADPVSGFGSSLDSSARLVGSSDGDADFFSFDLAPGDTFGAQVEGLGIELALYAPDGTLMVASGSDVSVLYPEQSPLPGNPSSQSSTALAHVARDAGTYALGVSGGSGSYEVDARVFRPGLGHGGLQTIFIDFDGAQLDARETFNDPFASTEATLSPLAAFLANWGLGPQDEDAVIDAILAVAEEDLNQEVAALGLNPDFAFGLLNSRDHADPFGDAQVSRVIVGGSVGELGISTIGIAESIDPGNFGGVDDSVVLLDFLSAPAGNGSSINSITRAQGVDIIQAIGLVVGNIVAHEAGHFLGSFHTENGNPVLDIMDQGGLGAATIAGVGEDGILGTVDDINIAFGEDEFAFNEGFMGLEDTLNVTSFALTGFPSVGAVSLSPMTICNSDLSVAVRDLDLDGQGSIDVTVESSSGDTETVTLVAIEPTWRFEGFISSVDAVASPDSGVLELQDGDVVTATYLDLDDGSGSSALATATVGSDCAPPVITEIAATKVTDASALVSFETSDPATSRIEFGTSCGSLDQSLTGALETSHRFELGNLSSGSPFFYTVTATDPLGNVSVQDNGGQCFSFATDTASQVFYENFDSGLGDFAIESRAGDLSWQLTSACEAGASGHSTPGALFFGNESACDYVTEQPSAATVTSPVIVVPGGASRLRFNYIRQTRPSVNGFTGAPTELSPVTDRAIVEISVNGGPFVAVAGNTGDGHLLETKTDWTPYAIELTPYLGTDGGAVQVRFIFDMVYPTDEDEAFSGVYIDDVEIVNLVGTATQCTSDADCDDGLFCNGAESCVTGRCLAGTNPCDDGAVCTIPVDVCDESLPSKCEQAFADDFLCFATLGGQEQRLFCDDVLTCQPDDPQANVLGCYPRPRCDGAGEVCDEENLQCLYDEGPGLPPTLGPIEIAADPAGASITVSGMASDPDSEIADVQVLVASPAAFFGSRARSTDRFHNWSETFINLTSGTYEIQIHVEDVDSNAESTGILTTYLAPPGAGAVSASYVETRGGARTPDAFSVTNAGSRTIRTVVIDLGNSLGGAVFDPAGVPFAVTGGDDVGFDGSFAVSGDQQVTLHFSDFDPGESFAFEGDLDDAGGSFTEGAEVAGATIAVTFDVGSPANGTFREDPFNPNRALANAAGEPQSECSTDGDCPDTQACTDPLCSNGVCTTRTTDCAGGVCDPLVDACVECLAASDCADDGLFCTVELCTASGTCEAQPRDCGDDACDEELDTCVDSGVLLATASYEETKGGATTPDAFSITNASGDPLTQVVIDLGPSGGGAVFDAVGVPFAVTGGDDVGFSGNFSLSSNQELTLQFSGFDEGETFLFEGDLDDAGGGYTTGSEVAGATFTVTRASGTLDGSFFAAASDTERANAEAGNQ